APKIGSRVGSISFAFCSHWASEGPKTTRPSSLHNAEVLVASAAAAGTERLARGLHAACHHRCAPRDFSQHRTKEIGAAKREVAQIIESLGSPLSSSDQQDHQNCNRNRQNHVQSERTSERCRKRFVEGLANLFHL